MIDKQLIKQEIERLSNEYPMSRGMLKHLTIFIDSLPEEPVSVEENDCATCINDKGCITCENGELHESAVDRRIGYHQGYDQAMQDFLEKAERWLEPIFKDLVGYYCGGDLINNFENYMQDMQDE